MQEGTQSGQSFFDVLIKWDSKDKFISHFNKGFKWPSHEPVNRRVVNQSRVHSGVVPEGFSDRAHANRHVHVVFDSLVEPFNLNLQGVVNISTVFLIGILKILLFSNSNEVFTVKDVGDHSSVKHVLDIFQEAFTLDIVI